MKILTSEILQSVPNDTKPELKESSVVIPYKTQRPNLSSVLLLSVVLKILHNLGFPINSYVKIPECHNILKTRSIVNKSKSLYFAMIATDHIKIG